MKHIFVLTFAFLILVASPGCVNHSIGSCTSQTCAGCCLGDTCMPGNEASACGTGGAPCSDCEEAGEVCSPAGACRQACGPDNCNGCCDSQGDCQEGTEDSACGSGGSFCDDCASRGRPCENQACNADIPCLPTNCDGCCDSQGECREGTEDSACGNGGEQCADCGTLDGTCDDGVCQGVEPCGPHNCGGCCGSDGNCRTGLAPHQCGAGGIDCQDCGALVCEAGACIAGCQDQDMDGYGLGCPLGLDCDDLAPGITGACNPDGCPQGWVLVPAGDFIMGCDEGDLGCIGQRAFDSRPKHTVYLDGFCAKISQVTMAEYRECRLYGLCPIHPCDRMEDPSECTVYSDTPGYKDNYPLGALSWHAVRATCGTWYGGDLPTEAQWEKSARGTDGRAYPWGDSPLPTCEIAWYLDCGYESSTGVRIEVGQFPLSDSPYGLTDTYGILQEWTRDLFDEGFYEQCVSPCSNPYNPPDISNGFMAVVRGGDFSPRTITEGEPPQFPGVFSRFSSMVSPPGGFYFGSFFRCTRPAP